MPIADDDLERALRSAAVASVDTTGVVERVAAKRTRRRTTRAVGMSVVAAVIAFVVVGSVVLVSRDDDARITTPAATAPGVEPLVLSPDPGYLRGPLTMSGDLVSVAVYDRNGVGGYDFPPSRIVRFDPGTLQVRDQVDLKAEILSVADGVGGQRWAITRNHDPDGPVPAGHFLKRIDTDGTVHSYDLPAGTSVTDDVEVVEDVVVVPTATGDLMFDGAGNRSERSVVRSEPFIGGATGKLPASFSLESVGMDAGRLWYAGRLKGVPAVLLARDERLQPVRLPGGTDVSFAWVDDDTVLATSGGRLLRIAVDRD